MRMARSACLIFAFWILGNSCRDPMARFIERDCVEVDESLVSLGFNFPAFQIIDDSLVLIMTIKAQDELYLFNYRNGKLIKSLNLSKISADSIIDQYVKGKVTGAIVIPFNDSIELDRSLPKKKHYYFWYDRTSQDLFIGYCPAVKMLLTHREGIDTIREEIYSSSTFILKTDIELKRREIVPIKAIPPLPSQELSKYNPGIHFGFFIENNAVYINNDKTNKTDSVKSILKGQIISGAHGKLIQWETPMIPYPGEGKVRQNAWFFSTFSKDAHGRLWGSNQEAIYELATGSKKTITFLTNPFIEQIKKFSFYDEKIIAHVIYNDTSHSYEYFHTYLAAVNTSNNRVIAKYNLEKSGGVVDIFQNKCLVLREINQKMYFCVYELVVD